jgi:hypothetical protein
MDVLVPREIHESGLIWYSNDSVENNEEEHKKIMEFGETIKDDCVFAQCSNQKDLV